MKLNLKAPGTKLLKLEYDELLSIFAFKLNLRRCPKVWFPWSGWVEAGVYTRTLFGST